MQSNEYILNIFSTVSRGCGDAGNNGDNCEKGEKSSVLNTITWECFCTGDYCNGSTQISLSVAIAFGKRRKLTVYQLSIQTICRRVHLLVAAFTVFELNSLAKLEPVFYSFC